MLSVVGVLAVLQLAAVAYDTRGTSGGNGGPSASHLSSQSSGGSVGSSGGGEAAGVRRKRLREGASLEQEVSPRAATRTAERSVRVKGRKDAAWRDVHGDGDSLGTDGEAVAPQMRRHDLVPGVNFHQKPGGSHARQSGRAGREAGG